MIRNTHLTVLLLCMLIIMGCRKDNHTTGQPSPLGNTPYQLDTILTTYGTNPTRALTLLDSALLLGNVSDYRAQFIRARIYGMTLADDKKDTAMIIAEALMEHDSVISSEQEQENILDLLVTISRIRNDDVHYLRWSVKKADLCRSTGADTEYWRTMAEIGLVTTHLGNVAEGMARMDDAIAHLDQPGSIDRMDAFVVAAKRKITALLEDNTPKSAEQAVALSQRIIDRLSHYEQHSSEYANDSYRLKWEKYPQTRDSYLDFYRAQAYAFMANAYAHMDGQKPKARESLARFYESRFSTTYSARTMIAPTLMALGDYDEATKIFDEIKQQKGADTLNTDYADVLRYRAQIAHAKGNVKEAYLLMVRHANLSKEILHNMHRSDSREYAARFNSQEMRLKEATKNAENQRMSIMAWGTVVVLTLVAVFGYWIFFQWRVIRRKNTALAKKEAKAVSKTDTTAGTKPVSPDDMTYEELYNWLREGIRREQLFLDPETDRSRIADAFHITERRVGAAFSQGSDYNSLPDFIRDCRLEFSCKLLSERHEMSIKEVAASSGFIYASTFSTDFKNRYNMTPTQYREMQTDKSQS